MKSRYNILCVKHVMLQVYSYSVVRVDDDSMKKNDVWVMELRHYGCLLKAFHSICTAGIPV